MRVFECDSETAEENFSKSVQVYTEAHNVETTSFVTTLFQRCLLAGIESDDKVCRMLE